MAIDPLTLSHAGTSADLEQVAVDFPHVLWNRTVPRFKERTARITFADDVRHERIVVPIPDRLISDEDTDFVAYIAPERKTLESGMRQSLAENPAVYQRIPIPPGADSDVRAAERAELFANALREAIVPWDAMVGKLTEDGEHGITVLYDLEDFSRAPLPSEIKTAAEWEKLPETEQADWTEVRLSGGRVSYRRYRQRYWRDAEGRAPNDPYYREFQADGSRRAFERNTLATRRAWKEHAKAWKAGEIPLNVEIHAAVDCLPLMMKGTKDRRWTCRGLVTRKKHELDDLIARGFDWDGLGGDLYPVAYDGRTTGAPVWLYTAWVYLEDQNPESEDFGKQVPCVIYCVEGRKTTQYCQRTGADEPAIVNLKAEYGLTTLPANYFYGAHTEADDPDAYGFPAMYPLLSPILNREGAITAYQVHLRKHALANKMATTPSKDVPSSTYMKADGSGFKEIDMDADVVMLPGPTAPLVVPPVPGAMKDLFAIYDKDIGENDPSAGARSGGETDASGHSLTVQAGLFRAANGHILEGARAESEWIGETAVEMIAALEEKFGIRVTVVSKKDNPTGDTARKDAKGIQFDPRDWKGNYSLRAYYKKIGNLAEIQQEADLQERNLSTKERVWEKMGIENTRQMRIDVAYDTLMAMPEMLKFLLIEALKRRGDAERVEALEAQTRQELQPQGLPTAALAPEAQMMAQLGPPGQIGPQAPQQQGQMGGVQLPNMAASSLGGTVAGAMGTAALQNEANTMAAAPVAGMGVGGA